MAPRRPSWTSKWACGFRRRSTRRKTATVCHCKCPGICPLGKLRIFWEQSLKWARIFRRWRAACRNEIFRFWSRRGPVSASSLDRAEGSKTCTRKNKS
ncbi:hypothetical protein BpHYR1_037032 [Brachionus plicatilis]|uniref:Uncharacterized protein n=1 Tax=Brachionus plicatilis TaxID=10195 RepID=A0A3M7SMI0_BRAPC|nr:hypothetical protein BpHYR1_037032 [Brachionus plicatilis]